MSEAGNLTNSSPKPRDYPLLGWLVLAAILATGAYFRFNGLNWDASEHLHPDERFLTMVESSLQPVQNLPQYFDTEHSTFNPNNVGYGFFVYGTLPIFIVRYAAEALQQTGYDQVFMVGRAASAVADMLAVLIVFLIAQRMFRRRWLSLLATGFYAFAVLPIQLSHFFAVDTFTNTFGLMAFYCAVVILTARPIQLVQDDQPAGTWDWLKKGWGASWPYLMFGLAYGAAMASKVSIVPLALLLPGAGFIAWTRLSPDERNRQWGILLRNLVLAGVLAFMVFRIGQPYAFQGPGFFGIAPSQKWVDTLRTLYAQSNADSDSPPGLQWARRPATFVWSNLVDWGVGLPLGLLATIGFAWMGWRILKGSWRELGLMWAWTGGYFVWQGLSFTRTMRYEIPVYPLLAIIAAWFIFELWDRLQAWLAQMSTRLARVPWGKILTVVVGGGALLGTLIWAFAFTRIYTRPMTRVEASQWIYQNVPGPVNLEIDTPQGQTSRPLSYPNDATFTNGQGVVMAFTAQSDGAASELDLPSVNLNMTGAGSAQLIAELTSPQDNNATLATGIQVVSSSLQQKPVTIPFDHPANLKKGMRYALKINLGGVLGTANLQSDLVLKIYQRTTQISLNVPNVSILPEQAYTARFSSKVNGALRQMSLPVVLEKGAVPIQAAFSVSIIDSTGKLLVNTNPILELTPGGGAPQVQFDPAVNLVAGMQYLVTIDELNSGLPIQLNGSLILALLDDSQNQVIPAPTHLIHADEPFQMPFTAPTGGNLSSVRLAWASQQDPSIQGPDELSVTISDVLTRQLLGQAKVSVDLQAGTDPRGVPVQLDFNPPIPMQSGQTYLIQLTPSQGAVAVRGSAPANESSWDDGLPLRVDGLDGYNGIYTGGLDFEMYWDDDATKLARFTSTLNSADYIFISSNRQWATTTRVQERYPLTTKYYQALMGCPADQTVIDCYSVAQPGMYQGQLGFTLIKVFQSEPAIGNWTINSQFAEEAFTVYDHPKVMIFQKNSTYAAQKVQDILGTVDLSKASHVTPYQAGVPSNLMLPSDLLAKQQEGGTWSDLFNRLAVINQYPGVGAIVWYVFFLLLGWLMYPLVRLALGGLADHGYPLARVAGMVVLAFVVWLGGSSGLPFTRPMIWLVLAGLLVVNGILFLWQRSAIIQEIKQQPRYYLIIEVLFLAFFLIDLGIRFGNPDLWHPAKGGEKPMDFSYLNAVLKSTSFPPYDPWFEGGYINYYYYGFVLIGVPIKALGIVPSIAYNLALPMLFAMVALGAFSVGWNLLSHRHADGEEPPQIHALGVERTPFLAGIAAALGMLILGNLGTINMIWEGFQLLVVPQDVMQKGDILNRFVWMFQGFVKFLGGMQLPYNIGEWYWNPSRVIPGEPITEFPNFTFLYADPHAHMIALPVTVLSLSWALSIVRGKWQWAIGKSERWAWLEFAAAFGLGGVAIGALRPTNTWDMPVYLALGGFAVLYTSLRYARPPQRVVDLIDRIRNFFAEMDDEPGTGSVDQAKWASWIVKLVTVALPAVLLLVALAFIFYQPFAAWYGQGYNALDPWTGDHTPMWSYRMQWGVFLFVIASWMVWETIDWMSKTPVSGLNKLRPYLAFIGAGLVALIAAILYLTINKVAIAWVPLLLGAWAVVLILRPGQPDTKRVVLFMVGSALMLTLLVEVVVLRGDLGRMNTVFKFYFQAWTLFSLSAAAALIWLVPAATRWIRRSNWGMAWQVVLILLIGSAALFPILAGKAKIEDRMSAAAPHTLDGMTYMAYSQYNDQNVDMNLVNDYRAIQWMQNTIKGSPVIVEANAPEYRWGTRFTIYTGLPGVVGWNFHQRQQRALTPSEWVTDRVDQIGQFYTSEDETFVLNFLRKYNVSYIVVGELERAYYPVGLDKFNQWNGKDWTEVYRDGDTAIYQVLK